MSHPTHTVSAEPWHRNSAQPLAEQLAQTLQERIRLHVYPRGARLPSVRSAAARFGVSPATVVAAYDRLVAQAWIEARPQSGFYVRHNPVLMEKHSIAQAFIDVDAIKNEAYQRRQELFSAPDAPRSGPGMRVAAMQPHTASHASAVVRGMFASRNGPLQPGMGVLPTEWLNKGFVRTALRQALQSAALADSESQYGEPAGHPLYRQAVAQRLAEIGIRCQPKHVVSTLGATHALDIASRSLLKPGDAVMVEEPGWVVEFARLANLGMRVLPVPRTAQGHDLEAIRRHCTHAEPAMRPKLLVSVSVLHNPTGACLSANAAHQVLQLAHQFNFHILEDDTYAHFAPPNAVRLASLDAAGVLNRVIYVGGFAKAMAPNWRVGFLVAPPAWVERLIDTKLLSSLTTPALHELAVAHVIQGGQLRKHADSLRRMLDAARARSVKLAVESGCSLAADPAGLFGWVDVGCDADALAQAMLDEGYHCASGSLFYAHRAPSTHMRMNFAATQDLAFWQALVRVRAGLVATPR